MYHSTCWTRGFWGEKLQHRNEFHEQGVRRPLGIAEGDQVLKPLGASARKVLTGTGEPKRCVRFAPPGPNHSNFPYARTSSCPPKSRPYFVWGKTGANRS